jgi:hypothetical protein
LRRGFRSRLLVEAAFVVLVAGLIWRDGLSASGVAASVAAAGLVVALAEWSLRGREPPRLEPEAAAAPAPVVASAPRAWNLWDLERSLGRRQSPTRRATKSDPSC